MNIKSLQQIWKNRKQIFQGIFFKFFKFDKYVEDVAAARLQICNRCSSKDETGNKCMLPGTQPCCGECGCSLAIKLRSMSTDCPLGKWEAVMSEELEDKLNK